MDFKVFEIIVLALINSGSIFLVIILLANSLTDKLYRWLAFMTITIVVWVNFAYLGYIDPEPEMSIIYYKINAAAVALFFFAEYLFYIDSFLGIRKKLLELTMFGVSVTFALLALLTDLIIADVTWQGWGNEITFGSANEVFNMVAIILNITIAILLLRRYFKLKLTEKSKVRYFLIGTFISIFLNLAFNVVSPVVTGTARYQHLGDYSAVLFLIFTAYAIIQKKFMNIKIALTAFLIGIIGMLLIVDILALSRSLLEQGLKSGILLLFVLISVLLIRSVLAEMKQREKLKRLVQEQKDIIDIMGHEIRTPLTVVVQELKLHERITLPMQGDWEEGKVESENVKLLFDSLRTMYKASMHTVSLVNDMLETARIDKGRIDLNYSVFDVIEEVDSCVLLAEKSLDQDNVTFNLSLKGKLEMNADKVRVREAVDALISNAVKYGIDPETGKVDITITVERIGDNVEISVSDKGIGIDAEDIVTLGKKFVRLNPKTSNFERPGGTGLGLFVVKGIADKHGGTLRIESEGIGKGSRFTIVIPINK